MTTLFIMLIICYVAYTAGLIRSALQDEEIVADIGGLTDFVPVPIAALLATLMLIAVCACWPVIMLCKLWKD